METLSSATSKGHSWCPMAARGSGIRQALGMAELMILFRLFEHNDTLYVSEAQHRFQAQTGLIVSRSTLMRGMAELQLTYKSVSSQHCECCRAAMPTTFKRPAPPEPSQCPSALQLLKRAKEASWQQQRAFRWLCRTRFSWHQFLWTYESAVVGSLYGNMDHKGSWCCALSKGCCSTNRFRMSVPCMRRTTARHSAPTGAPSGDSGRAHRLSNTGETGTAWCQ